MAKPALGRGLGALLGGNPIAKPPATAGVSKSNPPVATNQPPGEAVLRVDRDKVIPCPFQPRKTFDEAALAELADSIREQGIIQPLLVRKSGSNYELIAGERRWRAAKIAGLKELPVIVREADDTAVLEMALIENLQRENLNPIEESEGYAKLMEQFKLTQELVAAKVGKSRTVVANSLRLLRLPPGVRGHLKDGRLSVGHAKAILGLPAEKQQVLAAEKVLSEGLSVRQAEALVAKWLARDPSPKSPVTIPPRDVHITSLENKIRERVGTKVHLRYTEGKGSVEIAFFSDSELQRVLELLGIEQD